MELWSKAMGHRILRNFATITPNRLLAWLCSRSAAPTQRPPGGAIQPASKGFLVRFAFAPAQPAPRFEAAGVYLLLAIFDNESGIRWVSESGRVLIRSTNGSSPEQRLMKFQPEKLQARACIFFKHLSGACFAPPFFSQRELTTPGSFRPRRGRSNVRERGSPRAPSAHAGR